MACEIAQLEIRPLPMAQLDFMISEFLSTAGGGPYLFALVSALSHPLQSALFPNPDIADDQDQKEDQHLDQPEYA